MAEDPEIRLTELASLEPGWLDGAGERVQRRAIDQAFNLLRTRPSLASTSNIYPTPAGGVLLEFEVGGWDLSLECLPTGDLEFFGVEVEGSRELEPHQFAGVTHELLRELDARAGW